MKFYIITALVLTAIVSACKGETEDNEIDVPAEKIEVEQISTLFDETSFEDPDSYELLKELSICSDSAEMVDGQFRAPCTPEYFKFFPLKKGQALRDGFILQIRSMVGGIAIRRLLVFERENGQLVKLNGFMGNLIERRSDGSDYDDLLIRFPDNIVDEQRKMIETVFYNCLFKWNGSQYEYKNVEAIEGKNWGGKVKESMKDSMSVEIHKVLKDNQMTF